MKRNPTLKTINGVDAEEYFGTIIGPMAATIMEKLLYKFLLTEGEGMTGAELKLVQFAVERTYGTATRSVEVTTRTEQDIVAEKLGALDPDILRQIAGTNAKRDDRTIN